MTEKNETLHRFNAEVSKVLQLVIHSLYTNKDIFLRELISNASDACDKLRHLAITNPELAKGDSEFKITIQADKKARTISIFDNGIGMNREELIANLGTIAKSGTQEFIQQLGNKKDAPMIGQFGVGFYSSFMVAGKVTVVSTKAGEKESWRWESEGLGEFTIAPAEPVSRGTMITLHVRENEDQYLDNFRLRHIIQTYSDHIAFPIILIDEEGKSETVNTASALWMRPKSGITPEQYQEFYRHVAHSPDEPWLILHNKAEGKLEYTNLLFVPSLKPFDLFHPDRKRRVKLYVKRVFITEENADVVPHWLRFLRGIIDSEDLPLNISRETLQASPLLAKIRESVTGRVLSELKKKAESDEVGYKEFWKNYGAVLKEGLCEATSPRQEILEVCRFASTHFVGDHQTSLDAYIGRMKEGQEHIYYLTGEQLETLRASPQLEGFAKRGIEVLLFTDHVDDFWVNVVLDYKGKKFKSVTRADIDLDAVTKELEEKPDKAADDADIKKLCERIKVVLGNNIKDVRPTSKLTTSAVCLAVEEGAMDIRLERFLIEQKQLPAAAAKILEINPDHPIIAALVKLNDPHPNPLPIREREASAAALAGEGEFDDVVWLLFDQARILEGENITDPAAFTRRLQSFVEKSLAA